MISSKQVKEEIESKFDVKIKEWDVSGFTNIIGYTCSDPLGYTFFFPNGYGVSLIRYSGSYGGPNGLFEIGVLKGDENHSELNYDTIVTDDVIGHLDLKELLDVITQIKELE